METIIAKIASQRVIVPSVPSFFAFKPFETKPYNKEEVCDKDGQANFGNPSYSTFMHISYTNNFFNQILLSTTNPCCLEQPLPIKSKGLDMMPLWYKNIYEKSKKPQPFSANEFVCIATSLVPEQPYGKKGKLVISESDYQIQHNVFFVLGKDKKLYGADIYFNPYHHSWNFDSRDFTDLGPTMTEQQIIVWNKQ